MLRTLSLGLRLEQYFFLAKPRKVYSATCALAEPGLLQVQARAPQQLWSIGATLLLIIVTTYLFPGLLGHDPWKQDEAYIFGIVHHMLDTGDFIVPTMAGEPFMEKPPLYYWIAAGCAWLFSPWLALHDGARLATGIFMAITCCAIGWTGRRWWGNGHGRLAVLTLLSCLGIVLHGHMMLTDMPLVTGFAISLCGFTLARSKALSAGTLLGTGVGIGFLAKGLLAPGVIGLAAILLPICFRNWRERTYLRAVLIAVLAALPWLLIWPTALYLRSPALFMDWFWLNNVGRFLGFSVPVLGAQHTSGFWPTTIPWFTFPALPLAIMTLWQHRKDILHSEPFQLSVLMSVLLMTVLELSASARSLYALPVLLPISLLAAPAAISLPAMVDRYWDWVSRLLFGVLAGLIWAVWIWMIYHGKPPGLPILIRHLPADFIPSFGSGHFTIAFVMTLSAIVLLVLLPKFQGRGLISWLTGLTLCWLLVSNLWLPWIDSAKSYRSVFVSLQGAMPANYRCVTSSGLGESERAMLRYFAGINTDRIESNPFSPCDVLLINGVAAEPPQNIDPDRWVPVWEGARPGDSRERFWLYATHNNLPTLTASNRTVRLKLVHRFTRSMPMSQSEFNATTQQWNYLQISEGQLLIFGDVSKGRVRPTDIIKAAIRRDSLAYDR